MNGSRIRSGAAGEALALALVVAAALLLRLWNLGAGLPELRFPEDPVASLAALRWRFERGSFGPLRDGLHSLTLAIEGLAIHLRRASVDGSLTWGATVLRLVQDPLPFWTSARWTSALLGASTAVVVWAAARREGRRVGAVVAAVLLAVCTPHVAASHRLTSDVAGAFFAAAALLVATGEGVRSRRNRAFAVALAGSAILSGVPALPLVATLALAGGPRDARSARWGVLTGAIVVAWALDWGGAVRDAAALIHAVGDAAIEPAAASRSVIGAWAAAGRDLERALGPAALALAALGGARALYSGSPSLRAHVVLGLSGIAIAPFTASDVPFRAWLYLVPTIALLAGVATEDLARRTFTRPALVAAVVGVVGLALSAGSSLKSAAWVRREASPDTGARAARWLEEHAPPNTVVALPGRGEAGDVPAVPLRATTKHLEGMATLASAANNGRAWYWEARRLHETEQPAYELVVVPAAGPWASLDGYEARGVDFVVLPRPSQDALGLEAAESDVASSRQLLRAELVTSPRARIVVTLLAAEEGAPGPDLEIWQLVRRPSTRT